MKINEHVSSLIQLLILLAIVAGLSWISIPNFIHMQDAAREAKTRGVAHTVQRAMEDYAVQNGGVYSDKQEDILPMIPGGKLLDNSATFKSTEPQFGVRAQLPGQVGVRLTYSDDGLVNGYEITAFGLDTDAGPKEDGIILVLTSSD